MSVRMRLALLVGCGAVAAAGAHLLWRGMQSPSQGVLPESAPLAGEPDPSPAPDLARVNEVRVLLVGADAVPDAEHWEMVGTVRGEFTLPGRFTLRWRDAEHASRAADLTVPVDEAGRFVLRAPLASWQPFASYAFAVRDLAGGVLLEGWCVLDRTLDLEVPAALTLSGRILAPGGEAGAFEYGIRTASPSGGGVFVARGVTDDAGAFRQQVRDARLMQRVYFSARCQRTGRVYLFRPDPGELLRGAAVLVCRDVVARVSIVDQRGLRPDGLVVRAAIVDELQDHRDLAVTFDQASANDEILCSGSGLLEVRATAPGCRPGLAQHRIAADAPGYLELGQLVLQPESIPAELAGEVVDEGGQPVLRCNVIVIPYGWSLEFAADLAQTALVDEHGRFAMQVDRAGEYAVIVQHPQFPTFTLSEGPIAAGEMHRFTMPRVGAVRIEPAAAAALGAAHWAGPISYFATSSGIVGGATAPLEGDLWDLRQALPLPAGRHAIHICPQGLGHYGYAEVEVASGVTARLRVPMTPTRLLRGVVRDLAGRAVSGARLELVGRGIPDACRRQWFATSTDEAGAFVLVVPDLARTVVGVRSATSTTEHVVEDPEVPIEILLP